jgi:hypothetical protein
VVYAIALYIVFQIVVVIFLGINFFWSSRLPNKKAELEKSFFQEQNFNPVELEQFKKTRGYFLFLTTHEADSLKYYLNQAKEEMNDSTSNITQKH